MLPPLIRLAPAKVNLFLHVTGKTRGNYHALQSFKIFADIGDNLSIEPATNYALTIDGPYAIPVDNNNLVTKAVMAVSEALNQTPEISIQLTKNIPSGAGLGGGSSDAATIIKMLLDYWQEKLPKNKLDKILQALGSDVPACYKGKLCFAEGRGEILTPYPSIDPLSAVLVYPNQPNNTAAIFQKYGADYSEAITPPKEFNTTDHLLDFLQKNRNDLTAAAVETTPAIKDILETLAQQNDCLFTRMSGSGSACFGLFKTNEHAEQAAKFIKKQHPQWWVQSCNLS